jgi:hypothetical protein
MQVFNFRSSVTPKSGSLPALSLLWFSSPDTSGDLIADCRLQIRHELT